MKLLYFPTYLKIMLLYHLGRGHSCSKISKNHTLNASDQRGDVFKKVIKKCGINYTQFLVTNPGLVHTDRIYIWSTHVHPMMERVTTPYDSEEVINILKLLIQ